MGPSQEHTQGLGWVPALSAGSRWRHEGVVPHSKQHSEEEVELLPKPENFFPFLFFCFMCCVGAFFLFTTPAPQGARSSFTCAVPLVSAELDGVAAPPLQHIAFPKSSTAFPNFNNFRFVRFQAACCPCAQNVEEQHGMTRASSVRPCSRRYSGCLSASALFAFNIPKVQASIHSELVAAPKLTSEGAELDVCWK